MPWTLAQGGYWTAPGKGDYQEYTCMASTMRLLPPEDKIVSARPCTTNAIRADLKAINDKYGIATATVETVPTPTPTTDLDRNFHKRLIAGAV